MNYDRFYELAWSGLADSGLNSLCSFQAACTSWNRLDCVVDLGTYVRRRGMESFLVLVVLIIIKESKE